jgi:hypothetical protein
VKPDVIEGYTPNQGQRILDRRGDQTIVQDPYEFQPWYAETLDHPLLNTAPPVHSSNPLAQKLGYNDIKKPSPEEMTKFLLDISGMDAHARQVGPDMGDDVIGHMIERMKRYGE